ncbi:MAG: ferritin family protein [candidate division NC10 bacterium]|nr:ferritin family protein [candidate division NC10 bacterium]
MEAWQQDEAIKALQKAILMEREGKKFYQDLANRTQNSQGKSMFEFLVKDEQSHIDKLQAEVDSLRGGGCLDPASFEREDRPRHRESFFARAKEEILPKLKGDFTDLDAVKIALDMENKGYAFYEKAAAQSPDPMVRGIFQYLMGQEKQHRELLTNTLIFLGAPLDWFGKEERHMFEAG